MSFHRSVLVAIATFLTVGTTSGAFAGCCDWGTPVVYAQGSCGTCGTAYAPIVYATPVAPAPIGVGCGYCGAPTVAAAFGTYGLGWGTSWGGWGTGWGGCGAYTGCGGYGGYAGCGGYGGCGVQAVYTAPAPLYVVNQGPDYTGPGLMVPYRSYAPPAEYAPPPVTPPYGYYPHHYYPGPAYHHVYYRPHYYGPRYYGPRY